MNIDEFKELLQNIDFSAGADINKFSDFNLDIQGGFQDVNPIVFITIGEILGNILSDQLPLNVANSVGNIINLVGQILETWGTQIQYFENGPGRFYNPKYKNINNPYIKDTDISDIGREIELLKKRIVELERNNSNINN